MLIYLTKMHWPRLRLHKLKRKLTEKSSEKTTQTPSCSAEKTEINSEESKLEKLKGMLYSLQMASLDKSDENVRMIDRILEDIGDGVFLKHHEPDTLKEHVSGFNDENQKMPHPRTYSELITIREEKDNDLMKSVMSKSVHGGMTTASLDENSKPSDTANFGLVRKKSVRFSVECNDENGKYQRSMSLGITRQISDQELKYRACSLNRTESLKRKK